MWMTIEFIYFGHSSRQINIDSKFLETQRITDYSLLLGVHYRAHQHLRSGVSFSQNFTVDGRVMLSEEAQEDEIFSYPQGLVLVLHGSNANGFVLGPHIRGRRLRASAAGDEEVDPLLPGTASLVHVLILTVNLLDKLMEETLYLTVNLLDRFLSKQTVVGRKLQLVGATAMLLACKYEEFSTPAINQVVQISDSAYIKEEVLSMIIISNPLFIVFPVMSSDGHCFIEHMQEKLMANALQFNFSMPTPYVFMQRFLKAAESDEKLKQLSRYLIELLPCGV